MLALRQAYGWHLDTEPDDHFAPPGLRIWTLFLYFSGGGDTSFPTVPVSRSDLRGRRDQDQLEWVAPRKWMARPEELREILPRCKK